MNTFDSTSIWIVIIGLAVGSFSLRFMFLGLVGDRPMPEWLLRHLRYTAVAIIPALIAPLVLWPSATGGEPDLPRMSAAAVALGVGAITRNVLLAMATAFATLYGLLFLIG